VGDRGWKIFWLAVLLRPVVGGAAIYGAVDTQQSIADFATDVRDLSYGRGGHLPDDDDVRAQVEQAAETAGVELSSLEVSHHEGGGLDSTGRRVQAQLDRTAGPGGPQLRMRLRRFDIVADVRTRTLFWTREQEIRESVTLRGRVELDVPGRRRAPTHREITPEGRAAPGRSRLPSPIRRAAQPRRHGCSRPFATWNVPGSHAMGPRPRGAAMPPSVTRGGSPRITPASPAGGRGATHRASMQLSPSTQSLEPAHHPGGASPSVAALHPAAATPRASTGPRRARRAGRAGIACRSVAAPMPAPRPRESPLRCRPPSIEWGAASPRPVDRQPQRWVKGPSGPYRGSDPGRGTAAMR